MEQTILELRGISKSFGQTKVLKDISLSVEKGEFITFLGPSGCGKTTMIRIIAGLENPDSGRVFLNGADVTEAEPNHRTVNTIFQNYALFPHMNVFSNIGYSLRIRHAGKDEIKRRVTDALTLVKLEGYEKRMPGELSGGQRQRVAIARAVINNPNILLLDEPLGALDLQLRRQMQTELKRLQKQLGITFIYITHDQEEAMNMSDRVVVMRDGRFEQIGTPSEIYDTPKTAFTAQFIGTSNILEGVVSSVQDDCAHMALSDGGAAIASTAGRALTVGQKATFSIRSENVNYTHTPQSGFSLSAVVSENNYTGGMLRTVLRMHGGREIISVKQGIHADAGIGEGVYLSWEPEHAWFVDTEDSL